MAARRPADPPGHTGRAVRDLTLGRGRPWSTRATERGQRFPLWKEEQVRVLTGKTCTRGQSHQDVHMCMSKINLDNVISLITDGYDCHCLRDHTT